MQNTNYFRQYYSSTSHYCNAHAILEIIVMYRHYAFKVLVISLANVEFKVAPHVQYIGYDDSRNE